MNRIIKFRGRRIDNGEWVYGSLDLTANSTAISWDRIDNDGDTVPWFAKVDPASVGQFTGLLDKNGKEIYEGDILLLTTTGLREHCIVEWNSEVAGWCISLKVAGKWKLGVRAIGAWMNEADFRIQSNRFDNPELLNEK